MARTVESLTKELKKWQIKSKQKRRKLYFVYLIFILCFAYIIDEIASNINGIMQTEIIKQFFDPQGDITTEYIIVTSLCAGAAFFTFFYKVLADRFGRKPFLVLNTFGLGCAMMICYLSNSLPGFIVGMALIAFFIPCDTQIVYVLEMSSDKNRGLWTAFTKAIAVLGVAIVPPLRKWALTIGWHYAYLIPAILGLVCALICLLFVKESDLFIKNRISFLKKQIKKANNPEKVETAKEALQNKQGGIIPAVRYVAMDKSLLWIFIVAIILSFCTIATGNYSIMFYQCEESGFTPAMATTAMTMYPFAWAFIEILVGFLSDRIGRKRSIILSGVITLYGFLCFVIGIKMRWNAYVVGLLLGSFLGGYFASVDMINVISAEESPTSLRSSILSVINAAFSVGGLCATGILLLFNQFMVDLDVAYFALIIIVPSLFIGLLILVSKTPETKQFKLGAPFGYFIKRIKLRKETNNINAQVDETENNLQETNDRFNKVITTDIKEKHTNSSKDDSKENND